MTKKRRIINWVGGGWVERVNGYGCVDGRWVAGLGGRPLSSAQRQSLRMYLRREAGIWQSIISKRRRRLRLTDSIDRTEIDRSIAWANGRFEKIVSDRRRDRQGLSRSTIGLITFFPLHNPPARVSFPPLRSNAYPPTGLQDRSRRGSHMPEAQHSSGMGQTAIARRSNQSSGDRSAPPTATKIGYRDQHPSRYWPGRHTNQ